MVQGITPAGPRAPSDASPPLEEGKHLVLSGLEWGDYRRISDAFTGFRVRITYDRGRLEIMVTSWIHEIWSELLAMFVRVLADEAHLTRRSGGHTTFEREGLDRAIEPDHCFYLANEPLIRAKSSIDLSKDPPPDLAIETEVSHRAIKQLPIYEALRVPEVWRTDGKAVTFHVLQPNGKYAVSEHSLSFPFLRSADLLPFLQRWGQTDEGTLLNELRAWVKQRLSEK
jgi:Uma2 family endonuclease